MPSVERVNRTEHLGAIASGVLFGLSLIVAVGPQNTFVLVQGARRRHVTLVVGICAVSDLAMIVAGVAGAGAALAPHPAVGRGLVVVGAVFLVAYGALALRRAMRPAVLSPGSRAPSQTWRVALLTCLAFTWLNPGVYVDTVFLVGPVSHSHGDQAWWFAAGAMLASVLWFVVLGYGARLVSRVLSRPRAWRVLDAGVAAVMAVTASRLILTA
jgi:L-lysine exporter family protein LysE/ArgO